MYSTELLLWSWTSSYIVLIAANLFFNWNSCYPDAGTLYMVAEADLGASFQLSSCWSTWLYSLWLQRIGFWSYTFIWNFLMDFSLWTHRIKLIWVCTWPRTTNGGTLWTSPWKEMVTIRRRLQEDRGTYAQQANIAFPDASKSYVLVIHRQCTSFPSTPMQRSQQFQTIPIHRYHGSPRKVWAWLPSLRSN